MVGTLESKYRMKMAVAVVIRSPIVLSHSLPAHFTLPIRACLHERYTSRRHNGVELDKISRRSAVVRRLSSQGETYDSTTHSGLVEQVPH
jgi:hypothetical protein